ncbi:DUF2946 domain-containing protein [Burkholderia pseudomallei]|uniref:DUF2946 domain-containing protein n=1 Tax=Burkholderia pseudomallei TaxID=28450 RepID=UPI0022EA980C|nr:DUF2946 domain-containing protein [Burkholderia pseudomallei]
MPSRHRQKIGAFLGMLAILLSVVAPAISQVLRGSIAEASHHAHHAHHVHGAYLAAHALHLAHAEPAAHHHDSDSSPSCGACPYCGLIAHTPALPHARLVFSIAERSAEFAAPIVAAAFRPYTVLALELPRAPPTLS